jgi:drug/metabolite transporter (DMT)-like permease
VAHVLSFGPIAAGRCAVAALALLLVSPGATWRAVRALDGRRRLALAGAGVLLAAHFAFFLGGLLATSLAAAAALVSLEPLAVVVTAWLAFGERPTRREQLGLGLAMAGAIVVGRSAGQGEHRLVGDALVLVAVVLFGAYVALARGLRATMPTTSYAACVYTVAAVSLLPVALIGGAGAASAPVRAWLAVLGLGLVPTLLGHTLVQRAARHVPASVVALSSPGETVGAILIGAAMGLAPTTTEWMGAALVVAGAAVAVR